MAKDHDSGITLPKTAGGDGWHEAFDPGVDYEASGDVNHKSRKVTGYLQHRWNEFAHGDLSSTDKYLVTKDWEYSPKEGKDVVYGYIRTTNAMALNKLLYDPKNAGKTDEEIFTRKDNAGQLRDLQTVKALDKAINSHKTSVDGTYSRYTDAESVMATFGFSEKQINDVAKAGMMTKSQLSDLNKMLAGRKGYSRAYTSASANRSMNAFKSKYVWERRLYVPKGTNAYIPSHNAQESETIFGRGMKTRIIGVSVENEKLVIHEAFDGYKKG